MSSSSSAGAGDGLLTDLFRRRVLRIIGLYLGASWTVVEFTEWLTGHYLLTPTLVDVTLAALALALPSVALLAYTHGAPGPDAWTRREKIFLPLNAVVAAAILVVMFADDDLGFMTKTVIATNSDGDRVERSVPKAPFRHRVLLFYPEAPASVIAAPPDSADHPLGGNGWKRIALAELLHADLTQDSFVSPITQISAVETLRSEGVKDEFDIPLALKREVADGSHWPYFVTGTLQRADSVVTARFRLYETKTGRPIGDETYTADRMSDVIDQASVQIRKDLGIPASHLRETPDLPVAELVTQSETALRHWIDAKYSFHVQSNSQDALRSLRRATAVDSTFAFAHLGRYAAHRRLGRRMAAHEALGQARTYKYRLPEAIRYQTRVMELILDRKPDQALAAAEHWHALYPENLDALHTLAGLHAQRGNDDRAANLTHKLVDLQPRSGPALYRLGTRYTRAGRFEEALDVFASYSAQNPMEVRGYFAQGRVYAKTGRLSAAYEQMEKAETIDPTNIYVLAFKGATLLQMNRFSEAREHLQALRQNATTRRERAIFHSIKAALLNRQGTLNLAIASNDSMAAQQAHLEGPEGYDGPLRSISMLIHAGREAQADSILQRFETDPSLEHESQSVKGSILEYKLRAALLRRDTSRADSLHGPFGDIVNRNEEDYGYGTPDQYHELSARLALLAGRPEEAIPPAQAYLDARPGESYAFELLARAHHQSGDLDRAQDSFENALARDRGDARLRLHYARLLRDREAYDDAIAHLDTALTIWSGADPAYRYPHEARALRDTLSPLLAGTSQNP